MPLFFICFVYPGISHSVTSEVLRLERRLCKPCHLVYQQCKFRTTDDFSVRLTGILFLKSSIAYFPHTFHFPLLSVNWLEHFQFRTSLPGSGKRQQLIQSCCCSFFNINNSLLCYLPVIVVWHGHLIWSLLLVGFSFSFCCPDFLLPILQ